MTETLLLNEDLTAEYDRGYGGSAKGHTERHIAGLRSVALFVTRGGSTAPLMASRCPQCTAPSYVAASGARFDGPGVPHVCKTREPAPLLFKPCIGCSCGATGLQAANSCPRNSFLQTFTDAGKVTREELDAVKRDVQALARVAMMHRADAPFSAAQRQDACDIVVRLAEGR